MQKLKSILRFDEIKSPNNYAKILSRKLQSDLDEKNLRKGSKFAVAPTKFVCSMEQGLHQVKHE